MGVEIHPTAIVDSKAKLGVDVKIGPYCLVGPDVALGDRCHLRSHVVIEGIVEAGEENEFYAFCAIGGAPQDLSYKGEPTKVVIGNKNIFRESTTVHRATTKQDHVTLVGSNIMLMNFAHIAHDVVVEDNCILVNSVQLAGHVSVGAKAIICGGTVISQFCRVGRGVFVEGGTAINRDLPPYCVAYGNRMKLKGINIVGLKRSGFSREEIKGAMQFYDLISNAQGSLKKFVEDSSHYSELSENIIVKNQVEFIKASKLGIGVFDN